MLHEARQGHAVRALVRNPDKASQQLSLEEMVNRGMVHEVWFLAAQGQFGAPLECTEAKQVYEATLKLDPNNGVALNNLAFLIAENGGDLDDALTKAVRAKQLLPGMAEVSDTLGWIYLKKNLSDNAIEIFKDLVSKQPNQSTFHYHLAMALQQKGDRSRALEQLKEALKYNPPKEEKDKIQQMIGRLG